MLVLKQNCAENAEYTESESVTVAGLPKELGRGEKPIIIIFERAFHLCSCLKCMASVQSCARKTLSRGFDVF